MIDKIGDLLDAALADAGLAATSDIRRLVDSWSAIVGRRIATKAAPIALRGTELVVAVPDGVWRQELSLMHHEIREQINQALGRPIVAKLRFVGRSSVDAGVSPFQARQRRLRDPESPNTEAQKRAPSPPVALPEEIQKAFQALTEARRRRLAHDRDWNR